MRSKNFIIPLVIYPFDVMVSVAESEEALEKTLDKYLIDTGDVIWKWDNGTATGRCCIFSTNQGLIRLRVIPTTNDHYASLQHEIFHYVMHICKRIGMTWTPKSDEAYSYLIGYLTKEIYNKL